jgi:hypothetical protein
MCSYNDNVRCVLAKCFYNNELPCVLAMINYHVCFTLMNCHVILQWSTAMCVLVERVIELFFFPVSYSYYLVSKSIMSPFISTCHARIHISYGLLCVSTCCYVFFVSIFYTEGNGAAHFCFLFVSMCHKFLFVSTCH